MRPTNEVAIVAQKATLSDVRNLLVRTMCLIVVALAFPMLVWWTHHDVLLGTGFDWGPIPVLVSAALIGGMVRLPNRFVWPRNRRPFWLAIPVGVLALAMVVVGELQLFRFAYGQGKNVAAVLLGQLALWVGLGLLGLGGTLLEKRRVAT